MSGAFQWPDYWCPICDAGAEGCTHTPADLPHEHVEKKWGPLVPVDVEIGRQS